MDGWLYGLYTLLGVLVGGLFTYLGLRRQLKQQKEIDEIEWRRKVKSDPLLRLREELANIAKKLDTLLDVAHRRLTKTDYKQEEVNKELQLVADDWNLYWAGSDSVKALFTQCELEFVEIIQNIRVDYGAAFRNLRSYFKAPQEKAKFDDAVGILQKNLVKILEAQELINKKLEKL